MSEILDQLRSYVLSEFAMEQSSLSADDDLLEQGILDSMAVLMLVKFIEEKFGVKVADEEIVPQNFSSLNTITNFVAQKSQAQQAQ